jgi:ubiquinone/menaquinone biosynthesis C-methylase UbiE
VIVNLEASAGMLKQGRRESALWPERSHWLRGVAQALPFADETFDAVTCLEALEFFPNARTALAECVRVLRPGGQLAVTNRIGWEARLLVGRTLTPPAFERLLAELPLDQIHIDSWQVDYDLAWARKKHL